MSSPILILRYKIWLNLNLLQIFWREDLGHWTVQDYPRCLSAEAISVLGLFHCSDSHLAMSHVACFRDFHPPGCEEFHPLSGAHVFLALCNTKHLIDYFGKLKLILILPRVQWLLPSLRTAGRLGRTGLELGGSLTWLNSSPVEKRAFHLASEWFTATASKHQETGRIIKEQSLQLNLPKMSNVKRFVWGKAVWVCAPIEREFLNPLQQRTSHC